MELRDQLDEIIENERVVETLGWKTQKDILDIYRVKLIARKGNKEFSQIVEIDQQKGYEDRRMRLNYGWKHIIDEINSDSFLTYLSNNKIFNETI